MMSKEPRSFRKKTLTGWVALCGVLLLLGCGDRSAYAPPPPPKVTISQPVTQPVTDYLEFTGTTQAINTVQLKARVEGYLEQVYFKDGDRVKKGQLLFLIQQNTYEAKLKQAEADILSQKAKLLHAQTEYARFSKLVTQKAAAQTDVDNWLYQRDAAKAAVMAAEAQRDLAKLNLSYTKVTSPFDGRIGRRLKDPGNLVGAGEATLLADVDQIDPLYVYFTINERDLLDVTKATKESVGEAIRRNVPLYLGLTNEEGYPHQGYLDFASISLTATTGTLTLRGVFPNPKGMMLPGLYARIQAPVTHDKAALLVPQVAVGYDQLGPYVLVVDDKNVVQRRAVRLGTQVKDLVVIIEGVTSQDWIITNGLLQAIPGNQVTPVKEALPQAEKPTTPPGGQLKKAAP
ncbi:MAG: efflux RND transporter periplasmic adaptor subunit [Desulfobaccales bacterium]